MSSTTHMKKPLAIAVGAALAATFGVASIASADTSPFAMTVLGTGYMAPGGGEGKCGEGKCGGSKMFEKMDKDANGEVSRAEHDAYWAARFGEVDQNKDSQVTRSEMDAMHKDVGMGGHDKGDKGDKGAEGSCGGDKGAEGACGDDKGAGGGKGTEGNCGGSKGGDKSEMFDTMDTDGDAGISRAEHTAYWRAKFDAVDKNGDGVLKADEMKAVHEKMMEGKCGEGKCGAF